MIIIDEGASGKLIQTLKAIPDLEGKHCIRVHPIVDTESMRDLIIVQAQEHLPGSNLYFCEDGEAFLLAQASVRECKKTMLEIADTLGIAPVEGIGELYDLALHNGALLILLEKKMEANRKAEADAIKLQAQEQAEVQKMRKRQEILNTLPAHAAQGINIRRQMREHPELMMIEDDPFSRRLVSNVLAKQYHITELATAEGALAAYVKLAPDLLFLDINLPNVTGHELLQKIKTLDPKAYVVMLSGNADKNNVMQAMEHGAAGFVAKPFSRDKLFQYIERCPTITKENVQ